MFQSQSLELQHQLHHLNSHCLQGGKTEKIAFEMSRKLGAMAVRDVAPFPKP